MTAITPAEQAGWQRRAASLLGKLLELAAEKDLPPIEWKVRHVGSILAGRVPSNADCGARAGFVAWRSAITAASSVWPDSDREHEIGDETRLGASWQLPVTLAGTGGVPPRVTVSLAASIWRDELLGEDQDA